VYWVSVETLRVSIILTIPTFPTLLKDSTSTSLVGRLELFRLPYFGYGFVHSAIYPLARSLAARNVVETCVDDRRDIVCESSG